MIISVITLGCKVNACESGSIISRLNGMNHQASEGLFPADVYIINTCSVTAEADRKSRQYISKCVSLNPDCKIIIVGCSSQNNPEKFYKSNVIAVGGTHNKENFVS
ncbi:MAG: tRNA (N(6)-L-threonylcarbamoyladenosine(37)-C(2))-methylthiotransferase MtaB, partial [Clostridiales bacterium]|nr:tRNA (N(6)-L-threonylcarbamoyladenosine(37)-C(2))-methylthiotransferase MtaB [Clostridiales bacterium]